MTTRRRTQRRGWAFTLGVAIIKPTLLLFTRREWIGGEKLPATGGHIIVLNHISHIDPLLSAHLLYDHGRLPRYLAKANLFQNKALATFLTAAGQIPVQRLTVDAVGAYDAAVAAVNAGECVVVYPEGTLTRDPDLWPMRGKTGAARIALATGCPVIPVGHWGAQEILAPYASRPHLLPRRTVRMLVGDPVDLADLTGTEITADQVTEATGRIMDALTELVEELRSAPAPAERFDPVAHGVRIIGNPYKEAKQPGRIARIRARVAASLSSRKGGQQ
ncbi:lysophospholipid acyltransferase family protein [Nocardioides limicola]|uniref:lysophospholipid acyltransferase family protein n=1 Tax=Nocardioides limicola TaxID=2803368 RepID=UPI00193BB8B4|nr:lysophospholipid acyltransferase family protein [Nocardioides sp. DJM-14]